MKVEGKLAIVTGAAKGIGEASARRFRREGWRVLGVATSPAPEPLASDEGVSWVLGDVSQDRTWQSVVRTFEELGTAPSTLVLNAARAIHGTVLDLSIETWKALFDGNFFGAVLGAKTCLPAMIANGGGTVVVVSSIAGWMAEQQLIAYACTKATLIELAKSIAIDHARDGIRANVVAPGTTDTPSFRQGLESSGNPEEWREIRSRRNPLGRILTADEVASAVWFLSTEESSGMTGSVVTVDAGLTACYDFRGPDEPNYR